MAAAAAAAPTEAGARAAVGWGSAATAAAGSAPATTGWGSAAETAGVAAGLAAVELPYETNHHQRLRAIVRRGAAPIVEARTRTGMVPSFQLFPRTAHVGTAEGKFI